MAGAANERPFVDPSCAPTDEALREVLGPAFEPYTRILAQAASFHRDWNFSRQSGWMLKIHDRGKALCYLIPLNAGFRASMAIREEERANLVADAGIPAEIRPQIDAARHYAEGYALQFEVAGEAPAGPLHDLIARLIEMRR